MSDSSVQDRLRNTIVAIVLSVLCAVGLSHDAHAQSGYGDSSFYYEIGGAGIVESVTGQGLTTLPTSAYAGVNYSCGNFDFKTNIKALFDNYKQGLEDYYDMLGAAITGAIASLPAYILQRANPGLYEVFVQAVWRYEEWVRIAIRNCKEAEQMIREGENPYSDWIRIAKGEAWKERGAKGEVATDIDEDVSLIAPTNGVMTLDGNKCGGDGQPECRPISNTIKAGYRSLANTGSVTSRYWATEDDAADWGVNVLGDVLAVTTPTGVSAQMPGQGLSPYVQDLETQLNQLMTHVLSSKTARTQVNYEALSAPGVSFTHPLVNALVALHEADRLSTVKRLSAEIALAQTLDRALVLRRIIRTGLKEAHIGSGPDGSYVREHGLPELEDEINDLMFEARIRREIVSQTAVNVLDAKRVRDNQFSGRRPAYEHKIPPLRDGVPTSTQ